MSALIILVVAVCGYLFAFQFPIARFRQIRSSNWGFYLHALAWGILFATLSAFIGLSIDSVDISVYCLLSASHSPF
jgi:hypothetical protein